MLLIKLLCYLHNKEEYNSSVVYFFSWKCLADLMHIHVSLSILWHVIYFGMSEISLYTYFPLSPSFLTYLTVILWSRYKKRRYYDLSFLMLCCCLIIFFYLESTPVSKHLLKCTILSEPFLSLSELITVDPHKDFLICLFIHHCLLKTACSHMGSLMTNTKILLLNPYRSFIFLFLRKGICLIEHDLR